MKDYLQELNEQQLAAVCYDGGPSLVIAGAGSGKTRVLTYKITYLVDHGYDPRRILALTFTNKAAREMRSRIAALIGEDMSARLWMGTFHSMFLRILRYNAERIGFKPHFTIYDATDTKSVIKSIIKDLKLDEKKYVPSTVASIISNAKNSLISPSDYAANRSQTGLDEHVGRGQLFRVYAEYWHRCRLSDAMDFDDILFYTNILFRDYPDVLQKYQEFFQYILVDEYQDTNFAQHLVVSQLCRHHRKICVVGDDAQSIYSFRGANIQNILKLSDYYPDLKTFKLEQNYRSTQNILDVANCLIAKNRDQIPKRIFSTNAKGSKIQVIEAYTDFEESYIVANKIAEMKMRQAGSYDDFAILYRTNAQSRILEESLRKRNIPYRIYGGLSFYQRKEIKDALGYFRMAVNPSDDEALRRIINYPARGIGETTLGKIRAAAVAANVSMWDVVSCPKSYPLSVNSGMVKKLAAFVGLVKTFVEENEDGRDAFELGSSIFSKSRIVSSLYTDRTPENISRQENLNELLSAVRQFVEDRREQGWEYTSMGDFLSEVSLATDQDKDDDKAPKVTLMTVHSAKGLEFRNVFVVGMEDELFPSVHSCGSKQEIEEERRLLYVAITRAKENCLLTYAVTRYQNGMSRPSSKSRFLKDIDSSLLVMPAKNAMPSGSYERFGRPDFYSPKSHEHVVRPAGNFRKLTDRDGVRAEAVQAENGSAIYHSGMRIEHSRFGCGRIVRVETDPDLKVEVDFDNVGKKTLLVKFSKFKVLE